MHILDLVNTWLKCSEPKEYKRVIQMARPVLGVKITKHMSKASINVHYIGAKYMTVMWLYVGQYSQIA